MEKQFQYHIGTYVSQGKETSGDDVFRWSRQKTYTRKSDVTAYLKKWEFPKLMSVNVEVKTDAGWEKVSTIFAGDWHEHQEIEVEGQ